MSFPVCDASSNYLSAPYRWKLKALSQTGIPETRNSETHNAACDTHKCGNCRNTPAHVFELLQWFLEHLVDVALSGVQTVRSYA